MEKRNSSSGWRSHCGGLAALQVIFLGAGGEFAVDLPSKAATVSAGSLYSTCIKLLHEYTSGLETQNSHAPSDYLILGLPVNTRLRLFDFSHLHLHHLFKSLSKGYYPNFSSSSPS